MKDFFRHNGILILIAAILLALVTAVVSMLFGGVADPLSNLVGILTTPVRNGITAVTNWAEEKYNDAFELEQMKEELAGLKQRNAELEAQAREALAEAQAELKALREKPVEVAVEVDQGALQEARREAETRMQAKVDKAAEAQKKAEEQRKKAEEELAAVRQQLEAAQQTERQAAISGDKDLALFELLFSQGNEAVNKLHGLLLKVRGRGDIELAGKLQKALLALADVTRRCAEE